MAHATGATRWPPSAPGWGQPHPTVGSHGLDPSARIELVGLLSAGSPQTTYQFPDGEAVGYAGP